MFIIIICCVPATAVYSKNSLKDTQPAVMETQWVVIQPSWTND